MNYLLFIGSAYYPSGGWDDFKGSFQTLDEAIEAKNRYRTEDWWHIVSLIESAIVAQGYYN